MSSLPQRKKSADEIAKLREEMGIPSANMEIEEVIESVVAERITLSEATLERPVELPFTLPLPASEIPFPIASISNSRPVRSLKRSERGTADLQIVPEAVDLSPVHLPETGRVVKSLRKSEQIPIFAPENYTPPVNSKLPVHRHNGHELDRIRRQGAIQQMQAAGADPQLQIAHLAIVIAGYLFAIAAPFGIYFYNIQLALTASALAIATLIAGFILLKKPMSRHHAAFLAVIILFVIVFGALHYFP